MEFRGKSFPKFLPKLEGKDSKSNGLETLSLKIFFIKCILAGCHLISGRLDPILHRCDFKPWCYTVDDFLHFSIYYCLVWILPQNWIECGIFQQWSSWKLFVANWKSIIKLYPMVFELYVFHQKSLKTALKMLKIFHRQAKNNIDQNKKEVGRDTNSI